MLYKEEKLVLTAHCGRIGGTNALSTFLKGQPMQPFAMELAAEQIRDQRSRSYFKEVLVSYTNGNYRSATVMLWSVVVCDLLFKLEELSTTYGDQTACSLLGEVSTQIASNPKSPAWELWLVEEIRKRTKLLDDPEYQGVVAIQQHRHMAAHPIMTNGYELHSPTPEMVRADIRHALESILTKPALMTKKVFDSLVTDLEAKKDVLVGEDITKRYLDAAYYSQLSPSVAGEILKSLWRVVFTATDARCDQNRDINFRALYVLFDRSPDAFLKAIETERSRFSKLNTDPNVLKLLVELISTRPNIYAALTDQARTVIESFAAQNPGALLAWFTYAKGIDGQLSVISRDSEFRWTQVTMEGFRKWLRILEQFQKSDSIIDLTVSAYIDSPSYDSANHRFGLLSVVMSKMNSSQMLKCLDGIEKNNQTYDRGKARMDHHELKTSFDKILGSTFDYSQYPKFARTIGLSPLTG